MATTGSDNELKSGTSGEDESASLGELGAFHGSIVVLGALGLFPIYIEILGELSGIEAARDFLRLSYLERSAFGLAALVPAIVTFAWNLRFDLTRFLVGAGFSALMTIVTVQFILLGPDERLDFSRTPLQTLWGSFLIQSAIWLAVGACLGHAGLGLRRRMLVSRAWRRGGLVAVLLIAMGSAALAYLDYRRSGPLNVDDAIALGAEFAMYRDVTGRGTIQSVKRYGFTAGFDLAQVVTVRLTSGRELAVIEEGMVTTGISADLSTVEEGSDVQFRGELLEPGHPGRILFEETYGAGIRTEYGVRISGSYSDDSGYLRGTD